MKNLPHVFKSRLKADEKHFIKIDNELRELSKKWNVSYISPSSLLCNQDGCQTMVNHLPENVLSFDEAHLTESGSNYVVSLFKDDPFFRIHKP